MNSEKNLKGKPKKKGLFYNFCYDFVKFTGALPILLWLRPKIYRPFGTKTPKGGVLITANHRSLIDPVTVHTAFPWRRLHCLATKELYNTKLKSAFFNRMHCIMVDKENFSLASFHEVEEQLRSGHAVLIFPEGGLNHDKEDTIHAFKSGAVLMAHKAGAPILPIYIVKREKWYERQRIVIGEPFDVRSETGRLPSMTQLTEASETLRKKEIELCEYFEALPIGKKLRAKHGKASQVHSEENAKDEHKV